MTSTSLQRGAPRRGGFTLVEVLVSLAIFSLAAVALGAAYVNLILAHDALRREDQSVEAMRLARRALLAEPDLAKAETGGEVVLADERVVKWTSEVEPMPVADLFSVRIEIEVPGKEGVESARYEEAHVLLRPTWSAAADRKELLDEARQRLQEERAKL